MLQYIGARYVPIFYVNSQDPSSSEWEVNVTYEPMTWVSLPNGHMYISKKEVPANVGSPASNPDYWLEAGQYNAYIQSLQDQINDMNDGTVSGSLQNQISANAADISDMKDGSVNGSLQNQINTIDGILDANLLKRIQGKQIAIYGDSWCAGSFIPWTTKVSNIVGVPVHLQSANGRKMTEIDSLFDDYDADIYIISAMINDWNDLVLPNTFAASVRSLITKIQTVNPDAEIYFITMPAWVSHADFPTLKAAEVYPLELYRDIVWHMAAYKGARVIDGLRMPYLGVNNSLHFASAYCDQFAYYVLESILNNGDTVNYWNGMVANHSPAGGYAFHENGKIYLRNTFDLTSSNGVATIADSYYNSNQLGVIPDYIETMVGRDHSSPTKTVLVRAGFDSNGLKFYLFNMDGSLYTGSISIAMTIPLFFNALI